ncbi:MAG: PHP domain-containing protein [Oscillospiraceae bacterium]|jgi:hypothetical protein|nr:PHP domain-containing protein [Oscillospiraceae bacterium]
MGSTGIPFHIHNPYRNVDWASFRPRRTELHCHTNVSDGEVNFSEMVEAYYAAGYDCLAITDHGIVDQGWTKPAFRHLSRLLTLQKHPFRKPTGLTEERFREISEGVGREGRGMLRIPFGTEHSPGGRRYAHVCSWFCDVRSAAVGRADFEKSVRRADEAGGLCVIAHPFSSFVMQSRMKPRVGIHEGKYAAYVDKLRCLLEKYPSLLGVEIKDVRERKLWDTLLGHFAPLGRSVYAVGASDTHDVKDIKEGLGWVEAMLPENTVENLRECLKDGAFFAASRCVSFLSTPEFHAAHPNLHPEQREEFQKYARVLSKYPALYDKICMGWMPIDAPMPMVESITTQDGVISIEAQNCEAILWISEGKIIASGDTITLANCEGLGAYVRAELWGPGDNLYTQPFLLKNGLTSDRKPVIMKARVGCAAARLSVPC